MKKIIYLTIFALTSSIANAADFTMNHGKSSTIEVNGCAQSEVAVVKVKSSMSGTHQLTSYCLPVICAYTNESDYTWFENSKWTIKLLAKHQGLDFVTKFEDQRFDRSFDKILHVGIQTKKLRDELIRKYQMNGTCQGVFYDKVTRVNL
jgi:hypothetical protein